MQPRSVHDQAFSYVHEVVVMQGLNYLRPSLSHVVVNFVRKWVHVGFDPNYGSVVLRQAAAKGQTANACAMEGT